MSQPLRIVHITPYYAPAYTFGGVVRAVEGLAQAQVKHGHQVQVITTDALTPTTRYTGNLIETLNNVQVHRVPNQIMALRRLNLSTPRGLYDVLTDILPTSDIVHLHEFRTVEAFITARTVAAHPIPLILSPHGTLTQSTGRSLLKRVWDRLISPTVARKIDLIVGLTTDEAGEAQALWDQFGVDVMTTVVPNGVNPADFDDLPDPQIFRQQWGLGSTRVVLFMGRLHARKGVVTLVEAFKQANLPDTRLVIVGPDEGVLSTLQTMQDDRITLTGYLGGTDRLAALSAADVFVLPAVGEGLPMSALEALAAGVPVILSPECHLPEVDTAGAGLIAAPHPNAIASALTQILDDRQRRQQMAESARALIAQSFTWDQITTRMTAAYEKVL